jgi:hypothetical protein
MTRPIRRARRSLAIAEELHDLRLLARARQTLGNLLVRAGELQAGIALLEVAEAGASKAGDPSEAAEPVHDGWRAVRLFHPV